MVPCEKARRITSLRPSTTSRQRYQYHSPLSHVTYGGGHRPNSRKNSTLCHFQPDRECEHHRVYGETDARTRDAASSVAMHHLRSSGPRPIYSALHSPVTAPMAASLPYTLSSTVAPRRGLLFWTTGRQSERYTFFPLVWQTWHDMHPRQQTVTCRSKPLRACPDTLLLFPPPDRTSRVLRLWTTQLTPAPMPTIRHGGTLQLV
jgi:hypothetical protein